MAAEEFTDPIFFARYAAYVRHSGTTGGIPDSWVTDLREYWEAIATLFQPAISNVPCEAASCPGYLRLSMGSCVLLAPVFLAVSIPGKLLLDVIVCLGSAVRLDGSSVLCLSGSAVFAGVLRGFSDLDYCEYVQVRANVGSQIDARIARDRTPLFARGHVDNEKFARPDVTSKALSFTGKAIEWARLHYLGKAAERPMPVSNMSLVDAETYRRTWPFQEVVIEAADGQEPPQGLVQAERLGEYLWWLDEQIEEYLAAKPIKALKRALCLARISGSELAERALQSLNQPPIVSRSVAEGLEELDELLTLVPVQDGYSDEVERARRDAGPLADLEQAAEQCRQVALAIRQEFSENVELARELFSVPGPASMPS